MHIRSRNRNRSRYGGDFFPGRLFLSGAQGAWYDPSDYSTLFQNSTGTTPVTAVEQPVRLMLDRSKGLVLGSELVTNGGFDDATGWTSVAGVTVSGGVATFTAVSSSSALYRSAAVVVGRMYQVTVVVVSASGGSLRPRLFGGLVEPINITAPGTYSFIDLVTSANTNIGFATAGAFTGVVDSISVRELPGNHALAPNDASRPILRARYNLLTRTEEFDDAVWTKIASSVTANAAVAPDGTTTADKLIENTDSSDHHIRQTASTAAAAHNFSVYLKNAGRGFALLYHVQTASGAIFNLATGAVTTASGIALATASAVDAGNGWYRCEITITTTAGGNVFRIYTATDATTFSYTGDGTSGLFIWGAQLLTAADQSATGGAYQRVGAATDYDTGPPWRPYLAFDGSDDSMSTSSIDFSGTDEVTLFAGLTKLSDAARGIAVELGTDAAGTFLIDAPFGATTVYRFIARGSLFSGSCNTTNAVFKAPHTGVITGLGDISGDSQILRINGAQIAIDTSDLGTGNFVNAPLFIGRRNNTSDPFNGRLYGLTVLGRTATAPELTAMESWIAGKTGVSL